MGLNTVYSDRIITSAALRTKLRGYGRLLLLASIALAFSVGTARSYVDSASDGVNGTVPRETAESFDEIINMTKSIEAAHKAKAQERSSSKFSSYSNYKTSSTVGSSCTSLIDTQHTPLLKAPAVRTQRPVGKVAALGLLLGARFALAPPEQHSRVIDDEPDILSECQVARDGDDGAPLRSARAIAAYRQCQKELALGQIASSR